MLPFGQCKLILSHKSSLVLHNRFTQLTSRRLEYYIYSYINIETYIFIYYLYSIYKYTIIYLNITKYSHIFNNFKGINLDPLSFRSKHQVDNWFTHPPILDYAGLWLGCVCASILYLIGSGLKIHFYPAAMQIYLGFSVVSLEIHVCLKVIAQ